MRIEESQQEWMKIVQVKRMNADETRDQLENGELELERLVAALGQLEELLGEVVRIVDEIERAEVDGRVRIAFALLLVAAYRLECALCALLAFLRLLAHAQAQQYLTLVFFVILQTIQPRQ